MDIVLATTNRHKISEIKKILKIRSVTFHPAPADLSSIHENGKTFEANAVKKAETVARAVGGYALADDSGIEIAALGGRPGVRSARFAGPGATGRQLCEKTVRLLKNIPASRRQARFVCVIALADPQGNVWTTRGEVNGRIIDRMKGSHGFGYDPVFCPTGFTRTFAELSPRTKNKLSHRGRALKKIAPLIRKVVRENKTAKS